MGDPIIAPKRPVVAGWTKMPPPPAWASLGYPAEAWYHPRAGIAVISAVEVAKDADDIDRGPEYHISMSLRIPDGSPGGQGYRIPHQMAVEVLRHFDCEDAEEDNHVPGGIVRNFWRPVADRFVGMTCACKDSEPAMVEDKGDYVWRGAEGVTMLSESPPCAAFAKPMAEAKRHG